MAITTGTLFKKLTHDGVLTPGRALDLGCNTGVDALFIAKNGFTVDAVDADPEALKSIPTSQGVTPILSKIEDFKIIEEHYNLVSCQYVLHFLKKEAAHQVITNMIAGAIPNGVISFNVLGEKDVWKDKWTTWTREEMDRFLADFPVKVHKIITEEGMGMTKAGSLKYWHVLNYVLIKK